MKFKTVLAITALITVPTVARADEMTITNADAQALLVGLQALDCAQMGEGNVCKERFSIDGKTMMLIARDVNVLKAKLEPFFTARRQVILSLPTGGLTKDGNIDPTLPGGKQSIEKINEMAIDKIKVDLEKIALSKLQIDTGAKNNFGSNTLAAIAPLVDEAH